MSRHVLLLLCCCLVGWAGLASAQQPIPIIHPNTGGGGTSGGGVVPDNVTIKGNGASAGNPLAIKAVQVDGTTIVGNGSVGNPLKVNSPNGCVNPVHFGADPQGIADSEPGFSQAHDAAVAAGTYCMNVPTGTYLLNFPWWIKGLSSTSSQFAVYGAGGISGSTILKNNYVLANSQNAWTTTNGGCGAGVLWTTPLAGSTGQSMCDNTSWWLDLKQILLSTSLNGDAGFDMSFWFNANNTNTGTAWIIQSQGSDGTVAANAQGPAAMSYTWNGSTGNIRCIMNTSGSGVVTAVSAAISSIAGTTHYYECSWDGSNIRIFVDGTQSGSNAAATGTLVDKPFYDFVVGSGLPFPASGANVGYLGKLFGLRISKVARNTTNYTAPTSAITTCDSNTLYLINGTAVQSDEGVTSSYGPFVQPECITGTSMPGFANNSYWLLMHNSSLGANLVLKMSGIDIQNARAQLGYGLVLNQANSSEGNDIYIPQNSYVDFVEEGNSYFNTWINLAVNNALIGMEFLWPGQICIGCTANASYLPVVDLGGISYHQMFATMHSSTLGCLLSLGLTNPTGGDELENFNCDDEEGGAAPLIITNTPSMHIVTSSMFVGIPSIFRVADGVQVKTDMMTTFGGVGSLELMDAGFGLSSAPNSSMIVDGGFPTNKKWIASAVPPTDGKGEHYEFHDMSANTVTGTTAGTATLSCPTFTDQTKTCVVSMAGYQNSTTTAQLIMLPAGATSMGPPILLSGGATSCQGVTFIPGSNATCTGASSPFPCCTGSAAGTCNTQQFATLPANMSSAQTASCQTIGD